VVLQEGDQRMVSAEVCEATWCICQIASQLAVSVQDILAIHSGPQLQLEIIKDKLLKFIFECREQGFALVCVSLLM
jgi:hypothetical protein